MPKQYLTPKEAAEFITDNYFKLSPKTLAKNRCVGIDSPAFRKVSSRRIIYHIDDLVKWAESKISPSYFNTTQADADKSRG